MDTFIEILPEEYSDLEYMYCYTKQQQLQSNKPGCHLCFLKHNSMRMKMRLVPIIDWYLSIYMCILPWSGPHTNPDSHSKADGSCFLPTIGESRGMDVSLPAWLRKWDLHRESVPSIWWRIGTGCRQVGRENSITWWSHIITDPICHPENQALSVLERGWRSWG